MPCNFAIISEVSAHLFVKTHMKVCSFRLSRRHSRKTLFCTKVYCSSILKIFEIAALNNYFYVKAASC